MRGILLKKIIIKKLILLINSCVITKINIKIKILLILEYIIVFKILFIKLQPLPYKSIIYFLI